MLMTRPIRLDVCHILYQAFLEYFDISLVCYSYSHQCYGINLYCRIIIHLSDITDPKDLRLVHWNHKQSNLAIIWAWMLCVSYKLFCWYVTPFPDHRSIHTFYFANIWTIRILFVFLLYSNESKSGKTEK